MGKLFLSQNIEHVTLVLGRVERLQEKVAAALRIIFCPCIVAGHQKITAPLFHLFEKMLKLETAVALNAGIGRVAVQILVNKGFDDLLRKEIFKMYDVIGDADPLRDAARILCVFQGAAGFQKIHSHNIILIKTHRAAHTFISAG